MRRDDGSKTSLTLLGRLRSNANDQEAWNAFVERYGRKIYAWCRHWGLQDVDSQDVTQNVLMELTRQMSSLDYQPSGSFRAWLKTVAYRAWCDFLSARRRTQVSGGDSTVLDRVASPSAGEHLVKQLEEECEREMLEAAMARVRLRVQPRTWQAFVLTALEGK